MKPSSILCWAVGAALAATGCAGKGGVDRGELLGQMVSAVCTGAASCCEAASLEQDNRCRDEVTRQMTATIQDPQLDYDEAQGEDCVNAVSEATKACATVDYSPCFKAFSGNLPPGASCYLALDCARGPYGFAVCSSDSTCVQPKRGAPNEPCAYSCVDSRAGAKCVSLYTQTAAAVQVACHSYDGLTCASGPSGPTCQPLNGDCRQRGLDSCPGGGYCDTGTGACVAPVPVGGNCNAAHCVANAYCADGVCYRLKPLNLPCIESTECESQRCLDSLCAVFSPVASTMCGGSIKR